MIRPEFLSVPELAERWKQTPRQIIDHALSLRFALYFLFDGLAFDFDNDWYSATGAHEEEREFRHIQEWIKETEAHLLRNARGATGEFDSLGGKEITDLRAMIDSEKARWNELRNLLEDRDVKIKQFHFRGHLRAAPKTLTDIAMNGDAHHPLLAYHPNHPVQIIHSDRGLLLDGMLMRLEPYGDWKQKLTADDLFVSMSEIEALEASKNPVESGQERHIPKLRLQEEVVLSTLKKLGYTPNALPRRVAGSDWVKTKVWEELSLRKDLFTSRSFAKSWERLRKAGDIAELP